MYLSPRLHFGIVHFTVAQIFGPLQPIVNGYFQYSSTDVPALHAAHFAIFALQHTGGVSAHFPQQVPVLGFGLMYLSPRLHFGLAHFTVAQIFGRLQPIVNGFFLQYFRTDVPALHARHDAIFALQHTGG